MGREFWNSQYIDYKDCCFIQPYWLVRVFYFIYFFETSVHLWQTTGGHILCKTEIFKA